MSFHYGPGSVLSILPIISHPIVNDVSIVIYPHFVIEETEAGD